MVTVSMGGGVDWGLLVALIGNVLLFSAAAYQAKRADTEARLSREPALQIEVRGTRAENVLVVKEAGGFDGWYRRILKVEVANVGEGIARRVDVAAQTAYFTDLEATVSPAKGSSATHHGTLYSLRPGERRELELKGPDFAYDQAEPGRFIRYVITADAVDAYKKRHPLALPVTGLLDTRDAPPASPRDFEQVDLSDE